jgi:threonine dehydratase
MPKFAPLIKINNCQKLGATVVLHGKDFAEAKAHAYEIAREKGLAYIDGYDDPAIIAGQGTVGLEIVAQVPDLDAVIVPVGGGGLLAGVSLAVKTLRPDRRGSRSRRQFFRRAQCKETGDNSNPPDSRRRTRDCAGG